MSEIRATLQLDLNDGRNANAAYAGKALTAWAETLEDASRLIDPFGLVSVELLGTEAACLKLHALFRFLEHSVLDPAAQALEPYPRLKAGLALNVFVLPGMIVGGAIGGIVASHYMPQNPPVQTVQAATAATARVQASPSVRAKAKAFYGYAERDPAISGIKIFEESNPDPIVSVPRHEFRAISGLWTPGEDENSPRPREEVWDVIVTQLAPVSKPVKWSFKVNGLPFRAKIVDPGFLLALKLKTLPLQVHEGLSMRVLVTWNDLPVSGHWEADVKSYEIKQVLWPTPLRDPILEPGPLFRQRNDANDDKR